MNIKLRKFGRFLSTRDLGQDIRNELKLVLGNGDQVLIDFSEVDQMTHSCSDEVFGKLVTEIGLEKFKSSIKFINTDDTISTIIKYAMARRLKQNVES